MAATIEVDEQAGERVPWIDGARGLAVAGMVAIHVGMVTGLMPRWVHLYAMWWVAPLFLVLVAMLWRSGWRRRHWQLAAAAPVAQWLAWEIGFSTPNILVLILGGVLVMPVVARCPVLVVTLAVVQLAYWPVPEWWTGYPPGYVLGLLVAGRHAVPDGWLRGCGTVGSWLGLETLGRSPMRWYVGHLAAVYGLVVMAR